LSVGAAVKKVHDDIVALVALDMQAEGLLPKFDSPLWKSRMKADHLYSEHWLLSYEAYVQGWLPSVGGKNYVVADPFFSMLAKAGVRFYNAEEPWEDGYSDYSDDDYEEDDSDDEEEDAEDEEIGDEDVPESAFGEILI
jgi:hypothetical protein